MLKSTGDGLAHAQKMLIKATNEYCNKIKKDCTSSKIAVMYYTPDNPREKEGSFQADRKSKLKVATVLPDIVQLETKHNVTRNVISTSVNGTNTVSQIPYEPRSTANTVTEPTKTATSSTLNDKPHIRIDVEMTKNKTEILEHNTKKILNEKESIDAAVLNILNTRKTRPKTKRINHTAALLELNKRRKPSASHLMSTNPKAIVQLKRSNDQPKETINESIKNILNTVLKKPMTQKVDKFVALHLLEKLKVKSKIQEAQEKLYESSQTVKKNQDHIRPYYDNYWVQQFYSQRRNTPVRNSQWTRHSNFVQQHYSQGRNTPATNTQWIRVRSQGKDNGVKNEKSHSEKNTLNHLKSIPALKIESNKSILPTDLYGPGKARNKTTPELEIAVRHKTQNIVTARPNQRNQINNEDKKKIKQTESSSTFNKLSQLGDLELLLDKPQENSEKGSGSTEKKPENAHSSYNKTHIEVDELPLSVLLEIVRSRNQTKKVRDAAINVFGTKFLHRTPHSIPTSSDCERGKKGNEGLCFPSYGDKANKSDDSLENEKQ